VPPETEQLPGVVKLEEPEADLVETEKLQLLAASLLPFLAIARCGVSMLGIISILALTLKFIINNDTVYIIPRRY
jgi:hypothetical protein